MSGGGRGWFIAFEVSSKSMIHPIAERDVSAEADSLDELFKSLGILGRSKEIKAFLFHIDGDIRALMEEQRMAIRLRKGRK